jgi:hypothetical protein
MTLLSCVYIYISFLPYLDDHITMGRCFLHINTMISTLLVKRISHMCHAISISPGTLLVKC